MRRREKDASDKAARKKHRAQLREKDRIEKLKEQITTEILTPAVQQEYRPSMRIYDVRDRSYVYGGAADNSDGIIIIGGFVGELIISFACMFEYIQASP